MFLTLLLFFASSWGQVGTATDALGGASIANSHALDSAWTNPAGLAAQPGAAFGVQYFRGDVAQLTDMEQYGLTIMDNTNGFPGALGYKSRTYKTTGTGNKVHEQVFRLAAAVPIGETFVLGLSGYRVHTDPWNTEKTDQDNGDLSVLMMISPAIQVGLITRAVMGARDNVYGPSRVVPSGGVGAKVAVVQGLSVLGDLNYGYEDIGSGKRLDTRLGIEFMNSEKIALRVGYNNDDWRAERRFSAGFGWEGPKLRVGYSYQKETRQEYGESHTVDIWLSF